MQNDDTIQIEVIRHGDAGFNYFQPFTMEHRDPPLSPKGRRQATLLAETIRNKHPKPVFWSSTTRRALETAEIVSENFPGTIKTLDELRTFVPVGSSFDLIKFYFMHMAWRKRPAIQKIWKESWIKWAHGESVIGFDERDKFLERVKNGIEHIVDAEVARLSNGGKETTVLIFSHQEIIWALTHLYKGIPLPESVRERVDNCDSRTFSFAV
jgi:broad specificity phosphatase PhoE